MIPLVLGIGATFIILMGSIDLSVEGVLTSAAVILSMLVLNGANANDFGLLGVAAVLLRRRGDRLRQRRHPRQAADPVVHGDARNLVHRRRRRQRAPRRHGDPHQRPDDPRARHRALHGLPLGGLAGARLPPRRHRDPEPHPLRPLSLRARRRRGPRGALRHQRRRGSGSPPSPSPASSTPSAASSPRRSSASATPRSAPAGSSPPSPRSSSAAPRSRAARAACCRRWSAS